MRWMDLAHQSVCILHTVVQLEPVLSLYRQLCFILSLPARDPLCHGGVVVLWCSAANNTYQFLENGEYSIFIQHADREDTLSMECHFAQMNAPPDANIRKFIGTLLSWLEIR